MTYSSIFLKLNKIYRNSFKQKFIINKNKKNFNFFVILLKLNIIRKIIAINNKYNIIINPTIKLKFIFFSKKNQLVYINQNKTKKINKNNIYIYTTNTGVKSSLNNNKGGQIITKIVF